MATTSPDNLYSPDAGNQYALVQDLGAGQSSVQSALIRRANSYVGTTLERTAFTTAPEGVQWTDTDGTKSTWTRRSGAWAGGDTGWVNISTSLLAAFRDQLWARRIGNQVELRLFASQSANVPLGNTTIASTLPAPFIPNSSLPTSRGTAYFGGGWAGMIYLIAPSTLGVSNQTGAARTGLQGQINYMI